MDPNSGRLYPSLEAAQLAGVKDAVEIVGSPEAIEKISAAVREQAKRRRKAQKASRKRNRA